MARWQRAYVIATCAVIGGAIAYCACDWGAWPRLTYLPFARSLIVGVSRDPAAISYPGLLLWGAGGAAVGALFGAIACAIAPRDWAQRSLQLLGAWALTAVALALGYYTWTQWPW